MTRRRKWSMSNANLPEGRESKGRGKQLTGNGGMKIRGAEKTGPKKK